jgi:hypothetical protein
MAQPLPATLCGLNAPSAPTWPRPSATCMHVQVPTAVFSQPPMGTVGLTEAQAVERLAGDIDVFISKFKPMKNTLRWAVLRLWWVVRGVVCNVWCVVYNTSQFSAPDCGFLLGNALAGSACG